MTPGYRCHSRTWLADRPDPSEELSTHIGSVLPVLNLNSQWEKAAVLFPSHRTDFSLEYLIEVQVEIAFLHLFCRLFVLPLSLL